MAGVTPAEMRRIAERHSNIPQDAFEGMPAPAPTELAAVNKEIESLQAAMDLAEAMAGEVVLYDEVELQWTRLRIAQHKLDTLRRIDEAARRYARARRRGPVRRD